MDEKEKLYYLLIEYLKGNYDCDSFCNYFTEIYDIKLNKENLTQLEKKEFYELVFMAERFSNIEEDLKLINVYFSKEQIWNKAKDVAIKLKMDF